MLFPEELLHFIWQFRLFDQFNLKTVSGETVEILAVGQYNHDAGPDFEFAKLRIGRAVWSGHVEIHVYGKEWDQHKHLLDERYNSTILHVVWQYDVDAMRNDGSLLPTLQLKDYVDIGMVNKYLDLMGSLNWIPCEQQIGIYADGIVASAWSERMTIERLEYKCQQVNLLLEKSKNDWEKTLIVLLGRAFGMKVNAIPFETLMERLDSSLLFRYRTESFKLEALLFGVSGLLSSDKEDSYRTKLMAEFKYLQGLHGLQELSKLEWKFHRMRPYNFPTFRLGQLAAICAHEVYWFERICKAENPNEIFDLLKDVHTNEYWQDHFRFGLQTGPHGCGFSDSFIAHLILNCFVPILFAYGRYTDNQIYTSKALQWLNHLPKESNAITKRFEILGWKHQNAGESQAILHMKKSYCDKRKCLSCSIGLRILRNGVR